MHRRAIAILALTVIQGPALAAQQPTFRAGVELVEIDAVVIDRQGNAVSGLTADDFEIREDGTPQAVAAFSTVDIPIERREEQATAADSEVRDNQGAEGRVYVIALDDIPPAHVPRTRSILRRFVERYMGPADVAAISYLGRGSVRSQDFTGSTAVLLDAIERFSGYFSGEATTATTIAVPQGDATGLAAPTIADAEALVARSEGMFNLRSRMRAFRTISESLASIPGRRKAMLLVGTGATIVDTTSLVDYNGGAMPIELVDAHAAMQAASRGHIAIYPIDARGLTAEGGADETESPDNNALQAAAAAHLSESANLRMMAEITGGFAVVNQNGFDQGFTRLVQENSSYYILGYNSANDRRDGRFRTVQVRVTRSGLEVRSRRGYLAETSRVRSSGRRAMLKELSPAAAEAFASPVAARGLPLRVFAASYRGIGRNATVPIVIGLDPAALDLIARDGVLSGEIEVAAGATSDGKAIATEYHVARLALKPETLDLARQGGLQVLSALTLPPGRYQVRTTVGNRSGKAGSVVNDIEVPDYSKGPLAMSGVAMTSVQTSRAIAVRHKDPLRAFLPGTPTSLRDFPAGDTLALFVEVYDNLPGSSSRTVDLDVTVRDADGKAVTTLFEQRAAGESRGPGGGVGFSVELPLDDTPAGSYVMSIEARTDADDSPRVRRDVRIRIH